MGLKVLVVSGSRADWGHLEYLVKCLKEDPFFEVEVVHLYLSKPVKTQPDLVILLGDRHEILHSAIEAHLARIPIAHLCGGDVSLGSYDDAMRDCISRLATFHFATSDSSTFRLNSMGYKNVYLTGSTGIDYVLNESWKKDRPIKEPYVVVAYYPETIDGTVDLETVNKAINGRKAIWITPNPDVGVEKIPQGQTFEHGEFLNLIYHSEELIGNSSCLFYEAPCILPDEKIRYIGKRQQGRVRAWSDGKASQRIINHLRDYYAKSRDSRSVSDGRLRVGSARA